MLDLAFYDGTDGFAFVVPNYRMDMYSAIPVKAPAWKQFESNLYILPRRMRPTTPNSWQSQGLVRCMGRQQCQFAIKLHKQCKCCCQM
jgi:hypothetical protein